MKKFFCSILLIIIVLNCLCALPFRERIYVQTDKQLYLAGEMIRMKLLTTDSENNPTVFSKTGYAELVDDSIARIQIKVELNHGTGEGRMQLPVDLPTGYYRLIAYTQFMRNEAPDVFFEKNIAVVNTFQSGYFLSDDEPGTEPRLFQTSPPALSTGERADAILLQTNKAVYPTRDGGELVLAGIPENIHTLSVSIAGKEWIPASESGMSLFQKNCTKPSTTFTGDFSPEYEGHIVTGTIIDNQTGRAEVNPDFITSGLTFTGDAIRFFPGQQTQTGNVRFFTSGVSGMNEIAIVVFDTGEKYRVDIQSPFVSKFEQKQNPALRLDSAYYSQLLERSVALQVLRYFSEESTENRNISKPGFKMEPTRGYPLDDYTRFATMQEVFTEFIVGARFRRRDGKQELSVLVRRGDSYIYGMTPLVFLDGVPISDHQIIYDYDPLTVEHINVYYGPCMMGGFLFDGIVELKTYRRLHQGLVLNRSSQIVSYEGPQLPQPLEIPDYPKGNNSVVMIPDSRHTLLWNPDVPTNGEASIRLPFYTSDLTGEFQATVEGVTKDGQFIFATAFFKVER